MREGIGVSHGGGADLGVGNTAYKRLDAFPSSEVAVQLCGGIIYRGSRDQIPVPSSSDVLVLVAFQIRIDGPVRQVESERL